MSPPPTAASTRHHFTVAHLQGASEIWIHSCSVSMKMSQQARRLTSDTHRRGSQLWLDVCVCVCVPSYCGFLCSSLRSVPAAHIPLMIYHYYWYWRVGECRTGCALWCSIYRHVWNKKLSMYQILGWWLLIIDPKLPDCWGHMHGHMITWCLCKWAITFSLYLYIFHSIHSCVLFIFKLDCPRKENLKFCLTDHFQSIILWHPPINQSAIQRQS